MEPWLQVNHPLGMVLQVRDSLDRMEADLVRCHGRDLQITYGYLSSSDILPSSQTATQILKRALCRNATGSILVSTRRIPHLIELAAAAERDDGYNH